MNDHTAGSYFYVDHDQGDDEDDGSKGEQDNCKSFSDPSKPPPQSSLSDDVLPSAPLSTLMPTLMPTLNPLPPSFVVATREGTRNVSFSPASFGLVLQRIPTISGMVLQTFVNQ